MKMRILSWQMLRRLVSREREMGEKRVTTKQKDSVSTYYDFDTSMALWRDFTVFSDVERR